MYINAYNRNPKQQSSKFFLLLLESCLVKIINSIFNYFTKTIWPLHDHYASSKAFQTHQPQNNLMERHKPSLKEMAPGLAMNMLLQTSSYQASPE